MTKLMTSIIAISQCPIIRLVKIPAIKLQNTMKYISTSNVA